MLSRSIVMRIHRCYALSSANGRETATRGKSDEDLIDHDKIGRILTLPPMNLCTMNDGSSAKTMTLNDLIGTFSNFAEPKAYFKQKILNGNKELKDIYAGNEGVERAFRLVFPEIVQSRGITLLRERDRDGQVFGRWLEGNNQIEIELETNNGKEKHQQCEHIDALFVGGPSTLVASLLYQMRYPDKHIRHVFADRFDSNHDGSAYYYHQRHAVPVYASPVNRGHYYLYIDLYKRLTSKKRLAHLAETDRNHVKLSLSWSNIKLRYIFTIFLPNMWHMASDLWFVRDSKKSKMAQSMQHSFRTVPIVDKISKQTGLPVESMLLRGKNKSNYVAFAGEDAKGHFTWMNTFGTFPFHEIPCDGFGNEVMEVLDFPHDGLIAPMVIENLRQTLAERTNCLDVNDVSRHSFQLTKLYVKRDPLDSKRIRVSSVEWIDTTTSTRSRTTVNHLFVSLGPSGYVSVIPPQLTWWQHVGDCVTRPIRSSQRSKEECGGYTDTFTSLWRHTLNSISNRFFRGTQCLKDFGLAAGSTSVMMLGVDLEQTSTAQLDVFGRFLEGLNQHWTLIAQRDVTVPESTNENAPVRHYRFFAIQMTGGGNFPSRFAKPDYLVNLLTSTEKVYGLEMVQNHAVYDIVQSRGCGRAVSAQNTIAFQHLADNAAITYALGGIGMTTMFANGEKLIQMVEKQDSLPQEYTQISSQSRATDNVLDGIDYSHMVGDPQKVARAFGINNTMSKREKASTAVVCAMMIATAMFMPFFI